MATKSSNKVIIPISFVDEKNSLNVIKNNLLDLQKSMIGGQGKNFLGSIIPDVNDSIKAINKAMAQFNKPVSSKKAAGALGQNLTSSFYNLYPLFDNSSFIAIALSFQSPSFSAISRFLSTKS